MSNNKEEEETTFHWTDGYWLQETGANLVGPIGAQLCTDLNLKRTQQLLTPGFGVKNRNGVIIYDSESIVKKQRFYYDSYETNFGDGHYPFVKRDVNYPDFIDYWFVLDDYGYWVQQSWYSIRGINGDKGQCDALDALNDGPVNGIGIKNLYGIVVCPK
jgi:hypothetical protein